MKAIGVIQARLGSTRLPRKVLADIHGAPMLARIVERLRACRTLTDVVLSISTAAADDELAVWARSRDIPCFRGAADDIAARLHQAAAGAGADVLARLWGDCPLIAPEVVDLVVTRLIDGGLDYATNVMRGALSYPDGQDVEVYRAATLARLDTATRDPRLREFPQEWVIANRDSLGLAAITREPDLSDWHISVDYPEDLEAVRGIYAALADAGLDHRLDTLIALLAREPGLLEAFSGAPRNIEYQAYLKQMAAN